ncbi:IS30 family transposase [Chromohalobacter sp. 296-RDG]|uniref:IS30 family transposase n=1 Tax=Chromohalobacter sp. 296-RDG TaxID=2994062 RepID=UPI002469A7C8|nr:IS30 family transposase [Chromohalobacter sp. 296-RDG]
MGYRQLTQTQRYQIHAQQGVSMSQRQIARALGIHNSTVSRELRRNASPDGYDPRQAQGLSDRRRRTTWKVTKRLPSLMRWVTDQLANEWSPQQISGFMANANGAYVSHQWIYSLIWDDKARGDDLWRCLRQPKRRSKYRAQTKSAGLGKIPNRVGIEHRCAEVDDRLTIGHWEGDTVLKGHKQSRLVTLVELRRTVNKLNDRPRKQLGYRTPAQVFLGEYSGALDTAGAALIS